MNAPASPLIAFRDVNLRFGNVEALRDVNLEIASGEVLGLLGDNGAGKSSLVRVLAGVYRPQSGTLLLNGVPQPNWDVAASRTAGIETVFQDRALVEQQSIVTNIFMGRELRGPLGFIRMRAQEDAATQLIHSIGLKSGLVSPHSNILTLSGGERQGVAIARALYFKARLVILDEPTNALSLHETERVLAFIRDLRSHGTACLFISHNMAHAYAICDRFALMSHGHVHHTVRKEEITEVELVEYLNRLVDRGAGKPHPPMPGASQSRPYA